MPAPEPPGRQPSAPAGAEPGWADDRLAAASEWHRAGEFDRAAAVYREVLAADPANLRALHLGSLLARQCGHPEIARGMLEHCIAAHPHFAPAYNNLGNLLQEEGRLEEALAAYTRAATLAPGEANAHFNLGVLFLRTDNVDTAITAFNSAVGLSPEFLAGYWYLGKALRRAGRLEAAAAAYDAVLGLEPDNVVARHLKAACSPGAAPPSRAPEGYVETLFDRMAGEFDDHLAGLDYRAPELVADRVAARFGAPAGRLDILDAGCGTGLAAPRLRPHARRLVGVDLSERMLEHARGRGLYDAVSKAEIVAFMRAQPAPFDLIVCIDTLVYFGALEPFAAAAYAALKPGGWLVLTCEAGDDGDTLPGYRLTISGRYAHSRRYLEAVLGAHGFVEAVVEPVMLRTELDVPVAGHLAAARRPAGGIRCG